MSELLNTPLRECHLEMDAKMAPFSGWNLPINYPGGILSEHKHTRERASVFDICHMGEIRVAGEGAAHELDRVLARRVGDLPVGACRYNFMLNAQGGVMDDLVVYRMADDDFMLVVNAGPAAGDFAHLKAELSDSTTVENLSDALAKIDLQGPASADVLEAAGIPKTELPGYYHWIKRTLGEDHDIPCIVSRTGYTGELGFELYCREELAIELWGLLLDIPPVEAAGLGARDTLRLEAGLPLYGHEMSETVTPLEAGFGAMLRLDDSRDFIGKSALLASAPQRELIGIRLSGRRAARSGCPVAVGEREIGTVTSGGFGPTVGAAVALALVARGAVKPGDAVLCRAGGANLDGAVVALPFHTGTAKIKLG